MHYQAEYWGYYAAAAPMLGEMTHPYGRGLDMLDRIERLASGSAVVIFSVSGCCMCHAVKRLFCGMGANRAMYELDQDPRGKEIERTLVSLVGVNSPDGVAVPIVMAAHMNRMLVPLLKEAGAL